MTVSFLGNRHGIVEEFSLGALHVLGLYGLFGTLRYDVEGTDGESLWKRREILSTFGNPGEVGWVFAVQRVCPWILHYLCFLV